MTGEQIHQRLQEGFLPSLKGTPSSAVDQIHSPGHLHENKAPQTRGLCVSTPPCRGIAKAHCPKEAAGREVCLACVPLSIEGGGQDTNTYTCLVILKNKQRKKEPKIFKAWLPLRNQRRKQKVRPEPSLKIFNFGPISISCIMKF